MEAITPKQARKIRDLSQTHMADTLGVCLSTYRKMEAEPWNIPIEDALAICKELGFGIDEIFFGENPTKSRKKKKKSKGGVYECRKAKPI